MKIALSYLDSGRKLAESVKSVVIQMGHTILDLPASDPESDYPDIAYMSGRAIVEGQADRAIMICGAGLCTSICANKIKGIYASCCYDPFDARIARSKYNTNVLSLSHLWTDAGTVQKIVTEWLRTPFHESSASVRSFGKIQQMEANMTLCRKHQPAL